VQPDGVGILGDEFVDGQAFDELRSRHQLLLAVNENRHVLLFPLSPRSLFGGGSFAFTLFHVSVS
jgi:hypothetical protein